MPRSKKLSIGIIILVILGISIPLITWGILTSQEQRPIQWSITLYGPTVAQNKSVSYQEIMNESLFQHYINVPINYTSCDLTNSIINCSGITLWDLINYSKVDYGAANAIVFCGSDGCSMLTFNLTTIEQNASKVLIIYALNGVTYGPPPDDEGPLKSIVDYTLTAPIVSCPYNTKWLCGIQFVTI